MLPRGMLSSGDRGGGKRLRLPPGMLLGKRGAVPTKGCGPWGGWVSVIRSHMLQDHPHSTLLPLQGYGAAKGVWDKSLSIWGFN